MTVFGLHASHEQVNPTAPVEAVQQRAWLDVFGEKVLPQLDVTAKAAA